MPSILGHIIVIAVLAVPVYFSARYCIRDIRNQLNGGGCSACGGSCSGCSGNCAGCGAHCKTGAGKTAQHR